MVQGRGRAVRRAALACVVAAAALSGALVGGPSAAGSPAATRPSAPSVSGWLPYWSTARSVSVVTGHPGLFSEVSPFWYALRKGSRGGVEVQDHTLSNGTHASVVAALHAAHVRVLPTVTDSTGTRYLAAQLADPTRRAAVVRALTAVVLRDGLDGIDLDLEGFAFHDGRASWPTTRPLWVAFVRELHASLGARHRLLSVTIPPLGSATTGYWVYDPAAIAPYVHAVRLMAYD